MSNIDKIRQEIERRREANKRQYLSSSGDMSWQRMCGEEDCLVELLAFIDSLPEEQLTWQDIKKIVNIADDLLDDPKARIAIQNHSEEDYYQKVLDEYKRIEYNEVNNV